VLMLLSAETRRIQNQSDSCYVFVGLTGVAGNIVFLLDLSTVGTCCIVCR